MFLNNFKQNTWRQSSSVHPLIRLKCSSAHPFIRFRSSAHPFIRFVHPLIRSSASSVHPFIHSSPQVFIRSSAHPLKCSSVHPLIHFSSDLDALMSKPVVASQRGGINTGESNQNSSCPVYLPLKFCVRSRASQSSYRIDCASHG